MVLLDLTFLPFYFDLTFTVFFQSSILMHPELHNLDTVGYNLRNSATDLASRARETITVSRRPATVVTANGIVRTTEQAREHVQDVDTLATVQLPEDS